ncbi:MAG: BrxA/BrxB family bacilliredoxin [Candidatus Hydrogenedentes bacterium]|nr:BrxA/BrxB family bacilliredoxin [Candidatus Hydrogenedentota bacterium]
MPPLYDPEAVRPMWEELAAVGIRPLTTPEEVDAVLGPDTKGTTLLVINSVCGCAAGGCRPGVMLALQNDLIPDHLVTVFAGVDREATQRAREFMPQIPPSSPNIVLFKDGKPTHALQRMHIERMTAVDIGNALRDIFNKECTRQGPSVAKEEYDKIDPVQQCGSSIPLYQGN